MRENIEMSLATYEGKLAEISLLKTENKELKEALELIIKKETELSAMSGECYPDSEPYRIAQQALKKG